mgnify:CR=1 FL=1
MKSLKKFAILLFVAVMMFSVFATVSFANENESQVEVESSYVNEHGELIVVLKDGTKINLGVNPEIVDGDANISINPNGSRFVDSLQYMWKGMLCIFIVIGVLILSIYALNKASNAIANRKSENNE